ncbi:MAG: cytochrome P450 [Chloroflexi bacterium]|nr:cytochrome P450 [Chloroflexota bacterium]
MAGLSVATVIGDFDPANPEFKRDPHANWSRLRTQCPVARGGADGAWWALTRYDDIVAAAADDRTFTSTHGVNIGEGIIGPPRFPMHYDPPQQTQYRRVMNAPFLADNVASLEPGFRQNTVELLRPLLDAQGGELVGAFMSPLPTRNLATFLNIPDDMVAELGTQIDLFERWVTVDPQQASAASERMFEHARRVVALRLAKPLDPRQDLVTSLLQASIQGDAMDPEAVVGTLRTIYIAGHIALMFALSSSVLFLAIHADVQSQLRADTSLIPQAIEELLRLETPNEGFARTATRDVTIRGRTIAQGQRVAFVFTSANRDDALFEDPDEFRLDRDSVASRHLAFGHGAHKCPGAALSRVELRIALEEILVRTRRIALAGEPTYATWPVYGPITLPIHLEPA